MPDKLDQKETSGGVGQRGAKTGDSGWEFQFTAGQFDTHHIWTLFKKILSSDSHLGRWVGAGAYPILMGGGRVDPWM